MHERSSAHAKRIMAVRKDAGNKKVLLIFGFGKRNRHSIKSVGGLDTFARVLRRLQSVMGRIERAGHYHALATRVNFQ